MVGYIPRLADDVVVQALRRSGALLIEGSRGCGKTTTARQHANHEISVAIDSNAALATGVEPSLVLQGPTPLLIDEWQSQPHLWYSIRHEVDEPQQPGQFILTGSTQPTNPAQRHSGTARFSRMLMHTMTLVESGESTGTASLTQLAAGQAPSVPSSDFNILDLAERICRGGWPALHGLDVQRTQAHLRDYLREVCEHDIAGADGTRRDPVRVMRTLQSLARGVGTESSTTAIAKNAGLRRPTVIDYLESLKSIFISQDQPAWTQPLQTRVPLRKAPKRHLADPSLAVAALGLTPDDLLKDLRFFAQLFKSLVVHELRVLTDEPVFHARLSSGAAVDAIATVDGRIIFVEAKLGHHSDVVDEAADRLQKFASFVDEPTELLVVTGGGMSYRRPDGVNVIAIGSLGK